MPDQPQWRQAADAVERSLAPRLETVVQSPQFADAMVTVTQVEREMRRRFERLTRRLLHVVNLPTGSDIKRLSHQVADLDDRLRDIGKRLEDLGEALPSDDGRS